MKCCTFFGHHDCPDSLKEKILAAVRAQVEAGITSFYVGNQGHIDRMVLSCLRMMKEEYPDLTYAVVLAYLPTEPDLYESGETVLPEGIETIPKRFAIDFRNRWMIDRANGLYGLYLHYQYLLGILPRSRTNDSVAYATLREDARLFCLHFRIFPKLR